MTVTPQTNTTLEQIAQEMLGIDSFVITGHVNPDGDCLGSQLALAHALRAIGKDVTCVLAKNDPIPSSLQFLPGIDEMIPAEQFDGEVEAFVGVDVPNASRMGEHSAALRERAKRTFTIDHHANPVSETEFTYVDPDSASTTLLVWKLAEFLGQQNPACAQCAFTGLVTDTGRFQNQNTDVASFLGAADMVSKGADPAITAREVFQNRRLASLAIESRAVDHMEFLLNGKVVITWLSAKDFSDCEATKADSEAVIDVLRSIAGVQVACVLRDQGDSVRGSFRAKDDTDVAAFARDFNGGGHKAAAGFNPEGPLDHALETVKSYLVEKLTDKFGAEE